MKSLRSYPKSIQVRTNAPRLPMPIPTSTVPRRQHQTYSRLMQEQAERTGDSRILNLSEYHDLIMKEQELTRIQRFNKRWINTNVVLSVPVASAFFSNSVNELIQTYVGVHSMWMLPATVGLWLSWTLSGLHRSDVQQLKMNVHNQYMKLRESLAKQN